MPCLNRIFQRYLLYILMWDASAGTCDRSTGNFPFDTVAALNFPHTFAMRQRRIHGNANTVISPQIPKQLLRRS